VDGTRYFATFGIFPLQGLENFGIIIKLNVKRLQVYSLTRRHIISTQRRRLRSKEDEFSV
jgi:hypothetical protein